MSHFGVHFEQEVSDLFGDGKVVEDYWRDIPALTNQTERLGYPTQKPERLLSRIIKVGSNEEDLIVDPFCGCGTAIVSAHRLNRRWAGIDISPFAVETVMQERFIKNGFECSIQGAPVDLNSAVTYAKNDPFAFEAWAVARVPGLAPNSKQRNDGGIDGRGILVNSVENTGANEVLVQVKSGNVSIDQVKAFMATCENTESTAAGLLIVLKKNSVSRNMRTMYEQKGDFNLAGSITPYPKLQIWSIEEYFNEEKKPDIPPLRDPFTGKAMESSIFSQVN